ncbi:MAG TPA: hypothetical protein VF575_04640 [Candidatus Saccharimonadales bacterium]|jgi:A/G-specific adenine glycosylase
MNTETIRLFQRELRAYYDDHGRHDMPWRQPEADSSFDPYKILVSELMLQQTQVPRVTPKYLAFIHRFPSVKSLADATLQDVLEMWSGLGYNRRAKYLWTAAHMIIRDYELVFPATRDGLLQLPGVGPNTAGAIMAYAYNQPAVYVETNIRTVIIHHFFPNEVAVPEAAIRDIVTEIVADIDGDTYMSPREFYWALMDYGAYLKQSVGNLNQASASYSRQSRFEGSRRQLRGRVIRMLTAGPQSSADIMAAMPDARTKSVLTDLQTEGMIAYHANLYRIA